MQKTCRSIEYLRGRDGAGITEIADELDISKSVVHAHLATLRAENLVVKRVTPILSVSSSWGSQNR